MNKKLVCSECGKETETLIAKKCLKCNNQEMRKKFSEKYFQPKRKLAHTNFLGKTGMGMTGTGMTYSNLLITKLKQKGKKCKRCGTSCYGEYCWQCLNKLKREKLEINLKKDNSFEPTIGLCRICGKEIKGRDGTFLEGKGSCHKKCAEAKQKIKELVKEK